MPLGELHIASTFGLLLGVSLLAGLIAERIHLPKVTAYLLVGLLIGPMGPERIRWISEDHMGKFDPMLKLAMALVLFNLGCQFPFKRVRRIASPTVFLSISELVATFCLVTCGLLLFHQSLATSVLLGCLALATAPATTILVFKEFQSEGPVTEYGSFLVALNNLASILTFEFAFLFIQLRRGQVADPLPEQLRYLAQNLLGSVLAGILAGLLVSFGCGFLRQRRWLVLLVAVITFLLGVCESLHIPYMLTFLIMGNIVGNTSTLRDDILEELDHLTGLLCVLFFAVHGAELNPEKFLAAGAIGAVYIVCRILGKYFGIYFSSKICRQPDEVRFYLGSSLLAQAGAAIALAQIVKARDPQLGELIQTIILGSVVVFELIGPIAIRQSVLRAGEVPISRAIHHTNLTIKEQVQALWDQLLLAFSRNSNANPGDDGTITVADLVKTDVTGIHQSADFEQVIDYIEHSHDNTFPVVDNDHHVVGVIRYPLLANAMFDIHLGTLVRAEDLTTSLEGVLHANESLAEAKERFESTRDDCLPVVDSDDTLTLIGVVRRHDVMHSLIHHRRSQ